MKFLNFDRVVARLILLQRIELAGPNLKKCRKLFGRYIFTNFISKFFVPINDINQKYYSLMNNEYKMLSNNVNFENKKILSIGSGMGGLEIIINSRTKNSFFTIIEKDYISKKIVYGWDEKNDEGYNSLDLMRKFIIKNGFKNNFEIYNYDKDSLPLKKFDYIISLFSMDYHYDFSSYLDYIKQVSTDETKIIFDTIRPDYFNSIFQNVKVLVSQENTVHRSKRIICNKFLTQECN